MIKRMVVELDRDPALYADGNIVEVSSAHTPSHHFLGTLIYPSSGHERPVITTLRWTASLSDEKVIHLRKSASSCIWIISLSNIKFYQSLVGSPFLFVDQRLISYIASVLGIKEDSRIGIIQTLWNYIKLQGLQDKVDRRVIRADERLRPVRFFLLPKLFISTNGCFSTRFLALRPSASRNFPTS